MRTDWNKLVKVVGPVIKDLGIIPEEEHYDVAIAVIRECSEIAAKGGNILQHFGLKD